MEDEEALVAAFMEATGCGREDAFDRLASCGGHLDRAINTFFSIDDAGPSTGAGSRSRSPPPPSPPRQVSASDSSSEDAAVRARTPVPAQRVRISRWDSDTKPIVVGGRSKSSRRRNRSRGGRIGTADTTAGDRAAADGNRGRRRRFREFRQDIFSDGEDDDEETDNSRRSRRRLNPPAEEDVVNVSSSSDDENTMLEELDKAPCRPPPPAAARNATFEDLFKVPRSLTFKGGFHAAKAHAARRQRWLLANVQSSDDRPLPSLHQNRDVWGNDLVARCVRDRFVLWHADVDAGQGEENEARKVLGYYDVPHHRLPVVLVVDPVTGQAVDVMHGSAACELNDFMARLGPHTETKPEIPVVMARKFTVAGASSAGVQSNTRPATTSTTTTTTAPTSSDKGAAGSRQPQAPVTTTAMRKQPDAVVPAVAPTTCQTGQEQAPKTTVTQPEPAVAPCTGQPQPQPESAVEEKVCTVRVRLTDGRAVTKEFGSQCAVAALFAYCRSTLDAGGAPPERPFRLVRFVGLAKEEIGDQNASFQSLGLHLTTVLVHLG